MTKSILVVDDETSINFALEHLMKSEGYDVATAHDGDEAISCVVDKTHPDLILLGCFSPPQRWL